MLVSHFAKQKVALEATHIEVLLRNSSRAFPGNEAGRIHIPQFLQLLLIFLIIIIIIMVYLLGWYSTLHCSNGDCRAGGKGVCLVGLKDSRKTSFSFCNLLS